MTAALGRLLLGVVLCSRSHKRLAWGGASQPPLSTATWLGCVCPHTLACSCTCMRWHAVMHALACRWLAYRHARPGICRWLACMRWHTVMLPWHACAGIPACTLACRWLACMRWHTVMHAGMQVAGMHALAYRHARPGMQVAESRQLYSFDGSHGFSFRKDSQGNESFSKVRQAG